MTDTPTPEQSQHAADHVEGGMDAIDSMMGEIKGAVAGLVSGFRAEVEQTKGKLKVLEGRTTGRLKAVNARLDQYIGGNGGPLIEGEAKVIEHKPE